MKLGIMQPYLFPYLGYFDLINNTEKWIVFDNVQYIRHGWINRNRIFHPKHGWQYFIVPLSKHDRETLIKDIQIARDFKWKKRILGQLTHYKKKAPFFDQTYSFVEECLNLDTSSIVDLNVHILKKTCTILEIPFNFQIFSEMNIKLSNIKLPGDWALEISKYLHADEYINPPGGELLFDKNKFKEYKIKLTIKHFVNLEYKCEPYKFTPGLSIIDILMWNSIEEIKNYLRKIKNTV